MMPPFATQPVPPPSGGAHLRDLWVSLRPAQWTKNALVLAPLFFALGDRSHPPALVGHAVARAVMAAAAFCLVASSVYLFNDVVDRQADTGHPVRRHRPIAAGRIRPAVAIVTAVILLVAAAGLGVLLPAAFMATAAVYCVLQMLYTFALRRLPLLDVLVIAAGFVLRAMAGALAIPVHISSWLLLCTFLLALFLALCKRRHERVLTLNLPNAELLRPTLVHYHLPVLDLMIGISGGATIVAYALYTLSAETVGKFGTAGLGFTIPFVVFGIFRYLDLVYRHRKGGQPELILLTDPATLLNLFLYALATAVILFWKEFG